MSRLMLLHGAVQRNKTPKGPTAAEFAADVLQPILQVARDKLVGQLGKLHGRQLDV